MDPLCRWSGPPDPTPKVPTSAETAAGILGPHDHHVGPGPLTSARTDPARLLGTSGHRSLLLPHVLLQLRFTSRPHRGVVFNGCLQIVRVSSFCMVLQKGQLSWPIQRAESQSALRDVGGNCIFVKTKLVRLLRLKGLK